MAKVAWNSLPEWAQDAISLQKGNSAQITHSGHHLQISGYSYWFNGDEVARPGEIIDPAAVEETIDINALPDWARNKLHCTVKGSMVNITNRGNVLTTTGGVARYNNIRVTGW